MTDFSQHPTTPTPDPRANGSEMGSSTIRLWPQRPATPAETLWLTTHDADMRSIARTEDPRLLTDDALWEQMQRVDTAFKLSRPVDAPPGFRDTFMQRLAESGRKPPTTPGNSSNSGNSGGKGSKTGGLLGGLNAGLNDLLGGKKLFYMRLAPHHLRHSLFDSLLNSVRRIGDALPMLVVLMLVFAVALPAIQLVLISGIQFERSAFTEMFIKLMPGASTELRVLIGVGLIGIVLLIGGVWTSMLMAFHQRRHVYHVPIVFHGS